MATPTADVGIDFSELCSRVTQFYEMLGEDILDEIRELSLLALFRK